MGLNDPQRRARNLKARNPASGGGEYIFFSPKSISSLFIFPMPPAGAGDCHLLPGRPHQPSLQVPCVHPAPLRSTLHMATSGIFLKAVRSCHSPSQNLPRASYHTWNRTRASPLGFQALDHLPCLFLTVYQTTVPFVPPTLLQVTWRFLESSRTCF